MRSPKVKRNLRDNSSTRTQGANQNVPKITPDNLSKQAILLRDF